MKLFPMSFSDIVFKVVREEPPKKKWWELYICDSLYITMSEDKIPTEEQRKNQEETFGFKWVYKGEY